MKGRPVVPSDAGVVAAAALSLAGASRIGGWGGTGASSGNTPNPCFRPCDGGAGKDQRATRRSRASFEEKENREMATTKKKQELKVGITLTNPPGDQDRGAVIREPDWRPGDVAQVLGGPEVRIQKVMTGPDGAAGVEVMIGRPDPSAISDAPTFAIVPASVDRAFFDAKTLIPRIWSLSPA